MTRSTTTPILVPPEGSPRRLEKLVLGGGTFSEDWLQARIAEHPALLAVAEIEPGFGALISVAREVPCASGYIDNVYLTGGGDIVLVETKLWANPEGRRKVVTQVLDYIAALMRMDYADLETAVMRSAHPPYEPGLYDAVMAAPDALDRPRFIDAVARNLQRGRILALIVGDGIREEAQALASVVQGHAGAHFTLALVAIGVWRDAETGALLLVPDVLARTAMIERGIVRVVDGRVEVSAVPPEQVQAAQSITERDYYAALATIDPALPRQLQAFLERLAPYGVYPEIRKTLILRAEVAGAARPISFGYIDQQGRYWSGDLEGSAGAEIALAYAQALATLIGGRVADKRIYVSTNGVSAPSITQLLPEHAERWEAAIVAALGRLRERADA